MPLPTFSNHAGTMYDSFSIGKRGVQLLQGTVDPTGTVAPVGSLYLLRSASGNRVFQIDYSGNWTPLLSPSDIVAGPGISITDGNGVVTVSAVPATTKYKESFTSSSLANGLLTITHDLGEDFPIIQVYNDARQTLIPDRVYTSDANTAVLDLTSFEGFTGTWTVTVLAS